MKPKPKRVPIAPPTLKEKLLDHAATVIAVVATVLVLIILFGPMVFVELMWWFRHWVL